MSEEGEKLYPHCDFNVWLRDCDQEVSEPLDGVITGEIPDWLQGTLLRNGPGATKVGTSKFKHIFDGPALLHRFSIKDSRVTYQNRFVRSNAWIRNRAANRILFSEFGTKAVPDPCQTIFNRIASTFKVMGGISDNTFISVYPFGDQVYTLTEVPIMHRVDPKTLETVERKSLEAFVVHHSAHPHVMSNGDVYMLGLSMSKGKVKYVIVKFPFTDKGDMFEKAHIVCTVHPRWAMFPAYMHSFGITENYFVLVEHPLCLSLFKIIKSRLWKEEIAKAFQWYADQETHIVLIDRHNGTTKRYRTDTFAFFHIINCYEEERKLLIDLSTYNDGNVIKAFYTEAIEGMQFNKEYAGWCRNRPRRIEIPLGSPNNSKVTTKLLADTSCETPKINYEEHNGRPYNYCYGAGTDIQNNLPASIVKLDTKTGDFKQWYEKGWSPGEPVFVARPGATEEDDGVLLTGMVRESGPRAAAAHELALLVLDARRMREVGRARFRTPAPAPKGLHGWFLPEKQTV